MALRFHVGLPGPFAYSKRIGGRKRSKGAPLDASVKGWIFLGMVFLFLTLAFPFVMIPLEILVGAALIYGAAENRAQQKELAVQDAARARRAVAQQTADAASTGEYRGTSEIGYRDPSEVGYR